MQSTGILRKIDELGRIVIPIELRRSMSIETNDPLEILVGNEEIILRKFVQTCLFCGESENIFIFKNQCVCHNCQENLSI
ncbi:MAG: AbrB/MazE/SpoVT family DNA-binding domain-containing protein [Halanaerobiales bacterium]|nr:AbrB/MazE/SpoVT family DNA-binding domain-containing protein [Halanaerobiales bacterium]